MDDNKKWTINDDQEVFKCKLYRIHKMDCFLPSKKISNDFFSIHINNWVNTFALTEDGKVILVKQHRMGRNIVTYEVPAGAMEEDEDPDLAAKRELEEETGYVPGKLILMKKISANPAIQTNVCYFYLALGCKKLKDTDFDETEELELVLKDKNEVFNWYESDLIDNSVAMLSIMFAKDYMERYNMPNFDL
jgi:ADP-ribose pyrophosphatase